MPVVRSEPIRPFHYFNNRRILDPMVNIPPAEYELMYYQRIEESAEAA